MQPDQAEVKDLAQLTREMNPKQLRNSLKRAYRAEAKKVLGIARKSLHATRLQVKGNKSVSTDRTEAVRPAIGRKPYVRMEYRQSGCRRTDFLKRLHPK